MQESSNLQNELSDRYSIKIGQNETSVTFSNGSVIFTVPYSENALGIRASILIVDEFVRTEKDVINRVYVPFLTDERKPNYYDLTKEEYMAVPSEPNRQLYLSSIRRADEWSFHKFKDYVNFLINGDENYVPVSLPYNLGVKHGFISKRIVEQNFKESGESIELLMADYKCIPEKSIGNSFYRHRALEKCRDNSRAMVCMNDNEFITYIDDKTRFQYYQEKLPNEIRILSMDIALVENARNDNTAFWILRLIPYGNRYKRIFQYAESMHGLNSVTQALRAKQLFYEFDCDYCAMDVQGAGQGVFDICAADETQDEARGVVYPTWTVMNPEDVSRATRVLGPNPVPVVYAIVTGAEAKSRMLTHSRDILASGLVSFLMDSSDSMDFLINKFKFHSVEDQEIRRRVLNPYAQTNLFINEAINLEEIVVQGRFSAKEKSGRRKDRVMSYVYALDLANQLEAQNMEDKSYSILDYIVSF